MTGHIREQPDTYTNISVITVKYVKIPNASCGRWMALVNVNDVIVRSGDGFG